MGGRTEAPGTARPSNVKNGMGHAPELSLGSSGQSQPALDPDVQGRMGNWAHPSGSLPRILFVYIGPAA